MKKLVKVGIGAIAGALVSGVVGVLLLTKKDNDYSDREIDFDDYSEAGDADVID